MRFYADLHVHSRFSRATSKDLTLGTLAQGALKKGIHVLGTGDFTHPSWSQELRSDLVEAEPGLYRLKDGSCDVRFVLTSEISTIYKHMDKVRKVHHLVVAPDLDTVRKISTALARVGNIVSDGRPILGITSRNLLEIVLSASEDAYIVPAHIWTPWFSAMGSKSGYDSIKECYEDLEEYIFAVETGLSSDPPMNWKVKSLDSYHLISNSDAHSAEKLGREATVFDTSMDYFAMRDAMRNGDGLIGTVEFFPEEGKYHLDGHRDCSVVLFPEETRRLAGICPVCGHKITVGVLSRVEELSDRHDDSRPLKARPFFSIIPLKEIIGEIMQVGSASKRVDAIYERLISQLGGELPLLLDVDLEQIRSSAGETLALAVKRMRSGDINAEGGYDGRFGTIRVFKDNETDMLFSADLPGRPAGKVSKKAVKKKKQKDPEPEAMVMNDVQLRVINSLEGNIMITAGPGTGKTRTLVERMKAILKKEGSSMLAITFTTKAAQEIKERLGMDNAPVYTFHGLAARIMRDAGISFNIADESMLKDMVSAWGIEDAKPYVEEMIYRLSTNSVLDDDQAHFLESLRREGYYTYEGLILEATRIINEQDSGERPDHIMVDEFQDINPVQYCFLKALSENTRSLMVIGDPNQAIYGFRGSSAQAFDDFNKDYCGVMTIELKDTYRLQKYIADVSNIFIGKDTVISSRLGTPVRWVRTSWTPEFIAREIESLAGGLTSSVAHKSRSDYCLSDMAVIVRTRNQARPIMEALDKASIPFEAAYAGPLSGIRGISERLSLLEQNRWQGLVKGVGEKTLEQLSLSCSMPASAMERIEEADSLLCSLSGPVIERLEIVEESLLFKLPKMDKSHVFYDYARIFDCDIDGFIQFCKLSNDQGALSGEKVRVITAHAAKGLEFKCVFVTGLAQGVFPMTDSDENEEENLFYVAMTRAKDLLYLVSREDTQCSFMSRIPKEYCTMLQDRKRPEVKQLKLFEC